EPGKDAAEEAGSADADPEAPKKGAKGSAGKGNANKTDRKAAANEDAETSKKKAAAPSSTGQGLPSKKNDDDQAGSGDPPGTPEPGAEKVDPGEPQKPTVQSPKG